MVWQITIWAVAILILAGGGTLGFFSLRKYLAGRCPRCHHGTALLFTKVPLPENMGDMEERSCTYCDLWEKRQHFRNKAPAAWESVLNQNTEAVHEVVS